MNPNQKIFSVILSAMFVLVFAACGVQENAPTDPVNVPCTDCNPDPDPVDPVDPVEPECLPAPFWSPAPYTLAFSSHYVSGATCGEVRGDLPEMSWDAGAGIEDTDEDGYMTVTLDATTLPDGCYRVSYMGYQACDNDDDPLNQDAWAQYGLEENVEAMCEGSLEFLENTGSSKNIAFCTKDGEITGNGNMTE